MKKILLILLLSIILMSCSKETTLILTEEETEWLENHPVIYYATDPEFAPYEYYDFNHVHSGLVADYIKVIEEMLDVQVSVLPSNSWTHALELGRNNQAQFLFMAKTNERLDYFSFTEPFVYSPNVLMYNKDNDSSLDLDKIDQYTFGVLKDYSSKSYFLLKYPQAITKDYNTILEGVFALSRGEIDGFIADLGQTNYYTDKYGITQISIYDTIQYDYEFAFGVNKNNPLLVSILDKTLHAMSREAHERITEQWFDSEYKTWLNRDRTQFIMIAAVVIFISAFLLILLNIVLRRLVKDRTKELRQLNEELEDRVVRRTEKIESINHELEASIEALVTTQEQLVESEKYASLGKLLSSVAHEINTPLGTSITSLSYSQKELQTLIDKYHGQALSKKCFEHATDSLETSFGMMTISLKRISKIINKFKRLEATLITEDEHDIDINTSLHQILDDMMVKKLIPDDYNVLIQAPENAHLRCHTSYLYEVVFNLVLNAIQHSQISKDTIIINAEIGESLRLTIEDHGQGIDQEDIKSIFEPFFRSGHDSIGLGLTIVYNIVVNNLNGTIDVTSTPYEKTIFVITIPKK